MDTEEVEIVHDRVHDHTRVVLHQPHPSCEDTSAAAAVDTNKPPSVLPPMQALFEKTVCEKLKLPYKYAKVTVLLVHWMGHLDPRMDCGDEVERLKQVFETKYKFATEVLELDDNRSPQAQLDHRINGFILEHDGPCQSTLMIVYYTGHGFGPADGLYISGKREPMQRSLGTREPKAFWNRAQQCLWDEARADVLVILDTCFAGSAMKGTTEDARSFEVLAATSNDLTTAAGPESFSKALISALEDYADEPQSMPFTAFELNRRIQENRGDQHSQVLTLRGAGRKFIKLAPLSKTDMATAPCIPLKASSHVTVRFTFEEITTLEDGHIVELATVLSKAAKKSNMGINKIELVDHEEIKDDKTMTSAMNTWKLLALIQMWKRRTKRAKRAREEDLDHEPDGKRVRGPLTPSSNAA